MKDATTMAYFKEHGWKWGFVEEGERPKPRPTHWKYGASHMMIPTLTADLYDVIKEVHV